jgi:hypothetical protein
MVFSESAAAAMASLLAPLMRAFRALVLAGRSEAIRRLVELGLKAKGK